MHGFAPRRPLSHDQIGDDPVMADCLNVNMRKWFKKSSDIRSPVKAIMAAQNWILDRLPQGVPLVIIFGEDHESQTQIMAQEAIARSLQRQFLRRPERKFSLGYEYRHNFAHGQKGTPNTVDDFQHLRAFIKHIDQKKIYRARKDLFLACLKSGISVSFNDVVCEKTNYGARLDQRDPFTRHLVAQHRPDLLGQEIPRDSKNPNIRCIDGMKLSNIGMVEKAKAHIRESGARIYFQPCGFSHTLGDLRRNLPFEDSLTALFLNDGFAVLNVIPSFEDFKTRIPPQADNALKHSVKISNMNPLLYGEVAYEDARISVNKASGNIFGLGI